MLITPNDAMKLVAASTALPYVVSGTVLGVGSGSTVNAFISLLAPVRHKVKEAVTASEASAAALRDAGIAILNLNWQQSIGRLDEQRELCSGHEVPSRQSV